MNTRRIFEPALAVALAASMSLLLGMPQAAQAADVVNGWSATTTINTIYSNESSTMFKLNGVTQGCGDATFWILPLTDTPKSKAKHALLLAAFTAGKSVSLRCEGSLVSDFQIFE